MRTRGTRFDDEIFALPGGNERIYGLAGDDTFHFSSLEARTRFFGGVGDDILEGVRLDLINGDKLRDLGLVRFKGGPGDDALAITIDMEPQKGGVALGKFEPMVKSVETVAYALNVFPRFDRPDTLKVTGTDGDDAVRVRLIGWEHGSSVVVRTRGCDDIVEVEPVSGAVRIHTGAGKDTIDFRNGDGAVLRAGGGSDTIYLDGFNNENRAYGNAGADHFFMKGTAFGSDQFVFGGGGRDRFYVEIGDADHGTVADFRKGTDLIVLHDAELAPGSGDRYTKDDIVFAPAAQLRHAAIGYDEDTGQLWTRGRLSLTLDGAPDLDKSDFRLVDDDLY